MTTGDASPVSTAGLDIARARSAVLREAIELVSSMRFAISLLTVICIASVIGTVVKQHEPVNNVVNQFGPFWGELFITVGLTRVYSAWWFLAILAFLVVSTTLCIARNAPKILADLRNYKEQVRESSLKAFHLHASGERAEAPQAAYERTAALLAGAGWKAKVQQRREGHVLHGTMIAARRGASNRLGYIAAHSAIVLVCVGGLLDGDLVLRAQMWLQGKTSYAGGGQIADVPEAHRLAAGTAAFRANLFVPEGGRAGTAIINQQEGVVLQDLPFDVELKKFIVEYYETGMPRLFASEIVIHDRETGQATAATVKVNEPAYHRGIAIYQSSFDDGGSAITLRALPLAGAGQPFDIEGVVGGATTLAPAGGDAAARLALEFTGLRVINVENLGAPEGDGPTDVRGVDLARSVARHLGSGAKGGAKKELRNVGPSVSYKLRDTSGQAREFNNYMVPVELDGRRVFLFGVRESPGEPFRYLRIPADEADSLSGWLRLRGALLDPAQREKAAQRYAELATPTDKPEMTPQLYATALRALTLFAGAGRPRQAAAAAASAPAADDPARGEAATGGLQAISDFLETSVPEAERGRISEVLLRILNGSLFELLNQSRAQAGLAPLEPDAKAQAFLAASVLSLSDSFSYPAPVLLTLTDFKQVQASVFQLTRAPGQALVYLGCVLLIAGVFAMLYIRERRLWVWLAPEGDGRTRLTMALSSTRHTLAADAEFERIKGALLAKEPA